MTDETTPDVEQDEPVEPPIPIIAPDSVPEFSKPEFMVVGSTFIAQTPNGEMHLPMVLPTKLIRDMPVFAEDLSMLYYTTAATPHIHEALDVLDIVDSRLIALKYFTALQERQQARLGESRRSSRS